MESNLQGYDERRFDGPVREDLICSICQGVLKDPRTCRNREHPFCLFCISQHLRNSHTCPECREDLTPETLKDPPRFLMNTLCALKIKCDYAERGCPDYVKLEDLQRHLDQCDFTPVTCGNDECGVVVDRKDKELHERDLCQFRIVKCHDCKDIKARQNEIKEVVETIKSTQDEIKERQDELKSTQDNVKEKVDEMESRQTDMKLAQSEIKLAQNETKDSVDKMKAGQAEVKAELNKLNVHNAEMGKKQDNITDQVKQINASVNEIKKVQLGIKEEQAMLKDEISRQFQRMNEILNQLLHGNNRNGNGAHSLYGNQDIIIIGGCCGVDKLNTGEKFSVAKRRFSALPPTIVPRVSSASCIYGNDVIVTGGYSDQGAANSIEILKMSQRPLQWMMFQGKLPGRLSRHVVKVYGDLLHVIGGFDSREKKTYDAIYSLSLNPPYTVQLVARMPEGRRDHRAELVNNKLYILGGAKTLLSEHAIDSVVVYDFNKNEVVIAPSLPKRVCRMATVTWGNMIIIIGGLDEKGEVLNDVIMYDTETGQSESLPSLLHKRCGHSAVIMHDVISVLGGWNKEQEELDSVETFSMGTAGWKELPAMREKRCGATAVVMPCN